MPETFTVFKSIKGPVARAPELLSPVYISQQVAVYIDSETH